MPDKSAKEIGCEFEKIVAEYLGDWSVVSGSGAAPCNPGDLKEADWLAECKTHTTPNYKIVFKKSVWSKIKEEASSKFRFPVLIVNDGSQQPEKTWCMIPKHCSSSDDLNVVESPSKGVFKQIDTQISFEHMKAKADYSFINMDSMSAYKFSFDNGDVLVLPLHVFKEYFF